VKVSKIAGGIAAFIVAAGVIWTTSLNAFDTAHKEFVTVGKLVEEFTKMELREIKKEIRRLEFIKATEGLTVRQEWELTDLYDQLEDLQCVPC